MNIWASAPETDSATNKVDPNTPLTRIRLVTCEGRSALYEDTTLSPEACESRDVLMKLISRLPMMRKIKGAEIYKNSLTILQPHDSSLERSTKIRIMSDDHLGRCLDNLWMLNQRCLIEVEYRLHREVQGESICSDSDENEVGASNIDLSVFGDKKIRGKLSSEATNSTLPTRRAPGSFSATTSTAQPATDPSEREREMDAIERRHQEIQEITHASLRKRGKPISSKQFPTENSQSVSTSGTGMNASAPISATAKSQNFTTDERMGYSFTHHWGSAGAGEGSPNTLTENETSILSFIDH